MATRPKTATRPPMALLSAAGIHPDPKAVEEMVAVAVAVKITASENSEAGLADGAGMIWPLECRNSPFIVAQQLASLSQQ